MSRDRTTAGIIVTPGVCEALGRPAEEIRGATLRDLANWAYEKGLTWSVSSRPETPGGVTIATAPPRPTEERKERCPGLSGSS